MIFHEAMRMVSRAILNSKREQANKIFGSQHGSKVGLYLRRSVHPRDAIELNVSIVEAKFLVKDQA